MSVSPGLLLRSILAFGACPCIIDELGGRHSRSDGYTSGALVLNPQSRPRTERSAAYWVYDKSCMDTPDSKRAPRSEYNRVDWTVTTRYVSRRTVRGRGDLRSEELGTRVPTVQSDRQRVTLLTDRDRWFDLT
jgi:hypothetical protein